MPGHTEIECSEVSTTNNAAYEPTAPLEENLYDYIPLADVHQRNTTVESPPKDRESGYVISGLYQATSSKDVEDGYVIPNLEIPTVTTHSSEGHTPFLAEDTEGYVIANLYQPLQTSLLLQNSTSEATSDLNLPPVAQKGGNAVSELPTTAPQLQESEGELRKTTHAIPDVLYLPR